MVDKKVTIVSATEIYGEDNVCDSGVLVVKLGSVCGLILLVASATLREDRRLMVLYIC